MLASVASLALLLLAGPPARPTAPLDSAIARMGGVERLQGVRRVRFEALTQWQRTAFGDAPYGDRPSYEQHADLRDYALGAWRNTRRFPAGGTWREMTDLVRDTVAVRRMGAAGAAWAPLNVAYVDERRELFALAPERLLLAARAAADLRALRDTTIAGAAHARLAATVDGLPVTVFVRRGDGFLALVRWRAAQPNDFGLAPWGPMEAELWYSAWQPQPNGLVYPMQWDVRRVGRPYKRVSLLAAQWEPAAPADSFAVDDSLRAAFVASARRPMHDLPLDSARLVDGRLAAFGSPAAPGAAVKLGRRWVLLEAGSAPLNAERATAWLARADGGAPGTAAPVAAALLATPMPNQGGAAWLARQRVPLLAAPGAAPFVAAILRNHGVAGARVATVDRGRWLRVDGDSLWVEPVALPDAPGAAYVYVPALQWAYAYTAANPVHLARVVAAVRAHGWPLARVGTARVIAVPVPAAAR